MAGGRGVKIGDEWFRSLAETASTGIAVYDLERFYYVNPAMETLLGRSVESLLTMRPLDLVPEELRQQVAVRITSRLAEPGEKDRYEIPLLAATGTRWVELSADAVQLGDRRVSLGTIIDITERRRAQEALQREKERAEVTLASIREGVIRTDHRGRIDYLNPVAERLTGFPLAEAVGSEIDEVWRLIDESTRLPLSNQVANCLRRGGGGFAAAGILVGRRGKERLVDSSVAALGDGPPVRGAVLIFRDVTELRRLERRMSFLATHDSQTGLINRDELERRLRRCIDSAGESGAEHALCIADIDGLSVVNDTLGHAAGDELIRRVAMLVAEVVLPGDTLARFGGDELAVLIYDAPSGEAREIAERMRSTVAAYRFEWHGSAFDPRLSVGLVPIRRRGLDLDKVLAAATTACVTARKEGGDRVREMLADDPSVAARRGEMEWVSRIRTALDENRFVLYRQRIERIVQPSGDTTTSERCRPLSEILLRVRGDDGDLELPGSVVAAAERHNLIGSVDRWVLRHSLRRIGERLAAGKDSAETLFCVNVSGISLGDEMFLDYVVDELSSTRVEPRNLGFEITETAAVQHLPCAMRFISVLTGMGCSFVLDDFGSGLSSFAYLRNLQVAYLKIAAEFVQRLGEDTLDRELVGAIQRLATAMDIQTVAEGVELEATLEALRELGVELAQGYLLSKPEAF